MIERERHRLASELFRTLQMGHSVADDLLESIPQLQSYAQQKRSLRKPPRIRIRRNSPISVEIEVEDGIAFATGLQSYLIAYHRIIKKIPNSSMRTNEDEFGVIRIDLSQKLYRFYPAPILFPVQSTGAAGLKRTLAQAFYVSSGELLVTVRTHYYRENWGDAGLLLGWDANQKQWGLYLECPENKDSLRRTIIPGNYSFFMEKDLPVTVYGALRLSLDSDGRLQWQSSVVNTHFEGKAELDNRMGCFDREFKCALPMKDHGVVFRYLSSLGDAKY